MVGDVQSVVKTLQIRLEEVGELLDLLKVTLFAKGYLNAYSRLKDKDNFDEVKSYLSEKQINNDDGRENVLRNKLYRF